MPAMSAIEGAFCRSMLWRSFAQRVVLRWALDGHAVSGEILEVGGGNGAMAAYLARNFPEARITMSDVDVAMVDAARAQLAHLGNAAAEVADVTSLPYATGRFDAVMSHLMLHHVIDWRDGLAEAFRVLKPGGVLLGYDLTDTLLARWIHKVDGSLHLIISPDELIDGLASAGFAETTVRRAARDHLMRFSAYKQAETYPVLDLHRGS